MKEKLTEALGTGGLIIFYLLSVLFVGIPIWSTELPVWTGIIIFVVITNTNVLGSLLTISVYIYSFIVVLGRPVDYRSILFFVCAGIYFAFGIIPFVMNLVSALLNKVKGQKIGSIAKSVSGYAFLLFLVVGGIIILIRL